MGVVVSASVHAAEVYNKDGNKLTYGKVKAMHYISDDASKDGDQTYIRFGFKGETQINDQRRAMAVGNPNLPVTKQRATSQKTRLAFAGLKLKTLILITVVTCWVPCMTSKHGPICSLSSAATLPRRLITS